MRTHGWGGDVPRDDEHARRRILEATRDVIAGKGSATTTADVARVLGVSRQTVYRYFPSTQALLFATAADSTTAFLDRIAAHLKGRTDPAEAVVESVTFVLEALPQEPYVGLLLQPEHIAGLSRQVTSDEAMVFAVQILHRMQVPWDEHQVAEGQLHELAELMLRMVQSFLIDPGRPPRSGEQLRSYLRTWVAPAVRDLVAQASRS